MRIHPKSVIVATSVAGLAVVGIPGVAAAQASPGSGSQGIGDHCLVGTFRAQTSHIALSIKGTKVQLTGGSGAEDHISASGTDRAVFTHTKPFTGTYKGHQLKVTLNGSGTSSLHSNSDDTKVTSGTVTSSGGIRIVATYRGNTTKSIEHHQPGGTENYTCTASKLIETNKSGTEKTVEVRVSRKP